MDHQVEAAIQANSNRNEICRFPMMFFLTCRER